MRRPWILGISASHNGAFCLLHGDEIVVAVQEERLVGRKRSRVYGARASVALRYCLDAAGIEVADLSMIGVAAQRARTDADQDVALHPELRAVANRIPVEYFPHHLAHATSAFATSGFQESAVLVIDGLGSPWGDLLDEERAVSRGGGVDGWETLSTYMATPAGLRAVDKHLIPNAQWLIDRPGGMPGFRSLGGMFSAVAAQLFGDPMEAGKVMGLAPYGRPAIPVDQFFAMKDGLLEFKDDVPRRFSHRERWPTHEALYADLASSAQAALEVALLDVSARLRQQTGAPRLCYAGGVALNGIANQRLLAERVFEDLHIIPAAEDSGVAIGAAYGALARLTGELRGRRQTTDATGRSYAPAAIGEAVARTPAIECIRPDNPIQLAVELLCSGHIGGWFQGGSELGPRALGQRSILCDPRRPEAKDTLNRRVKHREPFRPFAPAVLLDDVHAWFELGGTPEVSPYMLRVCGMRPERRAEVPGVVHVDGTGRLQTVAPGSAFHELLRAFRERTGVPMLINTSFNVMGEPIVETPDDALWCMLSTGIDFCVLGDALVRKAATYRSLLDLVPRVRAHACRVNLPIADGRILPGIAPEMSFLTKTPWGDVEQIVHAAHARLMHRMDGRRTGHEIKEQLGELAPSDEDIVRDLALLRRLHLIELRAPE